MAKKATSAAAAFKAGEATFTPGEHGVAVSVGSAKGELVSWPAVARLAAAGSSVDQLLKRLDAWLAANRPRYQRGLLPGASAAQLAALEKTLGQPLPQELRAWLTWHNGQAEDLIGGFKEAFNLMSAGQIGEAWREQQKAKEPGWNSAWIPLLDDTQGDLVVLDPTSPGCAVRELWRGAADEPVVALSLRAWLAEFVADVETGQYHEDPERGEFHRLD